MVASQSGRWESEHLPGIQSKATAKHLQQVKRRCELSTDVQKVDKVKPSSGGDQIVCLRMQARRYLVSLKWAQMESDCGDSIEHAHALGGGQGSQNHSG